MDERKPEEHTEPDSEGREGPLEDLDVPESESEDVKGGNQPVHTYSFKQGWPKKYSG
jgi:hypothetical protein